MPSYEHHWFPIEIAVKLRQVLALGTAADVTAAALTEAAGAAVWARFNAYGKLKVKIALIDLGSPPPAASSVMIVTPATAASFPFDGGSWLSAGNGYCRPDGAQILQSKGDTTNHSIFGVEVAAVGMATVAGTDRLVICAAADISFTSVDVQVSRGALHNYLKSAATVDPTNSDSKTYMWALQTGDFADATLVTVTFNA